MSSRRVSGTNASHPLSEAISIDHSYRRAVTVTCRRGVRQGPVGLPNRTLRESPIFARPIRTFLASAMAAASYALGNQRIKKIFLDLARDGFHGHSGFGSGKYLVRARAIFVSSCTANSYVIGLGGDNIRDCLILKQVPHRHADSSAAGRALKCEQLAVSQVHMKD